jgi:hypothetical protein
MRGGSRGPPNAERLLLTDLGQPIAKSPQSVLKAGELSGVEGAEKARLCCERVDAAEEAVAAAVGGDPRGPVAALKELFGLQHDCERGKRLRCCMVCAATMGMWSSARRRKMKSMIDGAIRTSGSSVGPAASNRRSVNFET